MPCGADHFLPYFYVTSLASSLAYRTLCDDVRGCASIGAWPADSQHVPHGIAVGIFSRVILYKGMLCIFLRGVEYTIHAGHTISPRCCW